MKDAGAVEHRGLQFVLFALFEMLFIAAIILMFSLDPRKYPAATDAVGITWWFSFVGLLLVSWLIRRTNPRLARIGFLSVLAGFFSGLFLPAIP